MFNYKLLISCLLPRDDDVNKFIRERYNAQLKSFLQIFGISPSIMKILKLRFKNLNSLEDENTINFQEAPFSDTGVFAITGANGSGKSTILDAITLGLYGETFRFDRPASHVMTKRCADCYAEIEFAIGKERYRSTWQVQRVAGDPEGELLPPEMTLLRLTGGEQRLAGDPQQVCSKITEITGMNFRCFTRSILLAQGDFAAFLNALDSERLDILEKIISTDIYADYHNEIVNKAQDAQHKLDFLKQELARISLLHPVKREAFEHDLNDFKDQYRELQLEQNALTEQQSAANKIAALKDQLAEQEKSLKAAQSALQTEQNTLDRLDNAQTASTFQEGLDAVATITQSINQGKEQLSAYRSEAKQIRERLAELNSESVSGADLAQLSFSEQQQKIANTRTQVNLLNANRHAATQLSQSLNTQIREKSSALTEVTAWLEEHAGEQLLVDQFPELERLKQIQESLADLTVKQKSLRKSAMKSQALQRKTTAALQKQKKGGEALKLKLSIEKNEFEKLAQGRTLDDLEELRQEQQERVLSVRELNKLAAEHRKISGNSGFLALFKSKQDADLDADALVQEVEHLKMEIKREENIKLALDELVFGENLRKKMTEDRHFLIDGKPCPLCGSLQHPYASRPPSLTNSQQALADQQAKLKSLKAAVEATEKKIIVAHKQSELNKARQKSLLQIRSQWLTLCHRLNLASQDLNINNKKMMKRMLKDEVKELTEISSLASKYRKKEKNIEKLTLLIAQTTEKIDQFQANGYQLAAESETTSQLQAQQASGLAERTREEQALSDKILEQLTLLGESAPAKGKEGVLLERLKQRRHDYQLNASRYKGLIAELDGLKESESACLMEIKACEEQLKTHNDQLASEETTGLHLALTEKQKLILEQEQAIAKDEDERAAVLQKLNEKLPETDYSTLEQVSEILAVLKTRPALEQRKAELTGQVQIKTQQLDTIRQQLTTEEQDISAISAEEIAIQLHSINHKMDMAYQEAVRLEKLLKDQDALQQKYDDILLHLNEHEEASKQIFADRALLDAEHGMAFRRRVQNQVAGQLLAQTNSILEKISGRYYIRQAPSEQGLALVIEDTYQANTRRLPKTLSGGESFVVSLALALGLSEMASSGKSVDSLFLDEGFGNLDAETLYTVISTLEGLHTHGKIVGVISHVEAVQKRFKAQLKLVKKPNGMGMLKMAS